MNVCVSASCHVALHYIQSVSWAFIKVMREEKYVKRFLRYFTKLDIDFYLSILF